MPTIRKDSLSNITTIEDGDYRSTVELSTQRPNGGRLWLWAVYRDGLRLKSGRGYTHDSAVEACAVTVDADYANDNQPCPYRHEHSDYLGLLQHMALVL